MPVPASSAHNQRFFNADVLRQPELFRNQALASYHSTKSGHTDFEESTEELKPLTEEENAQKLEEVSLGAGHCMKRFYSTDC